MYEQEINWVCSLTYLSSHFGSLRTEGGDPGSGWYTSRVSGYNTLASKKRDDLRFSTRRKRSYLEESGGLKSKENRSLNHCDIQTQCLMSHFALK